jgi:hypothetical protein
MQAKCPYIMYQSKLESFVHKVLDIVCLWKKLLKVQE